MDYLSKIRRPIEGEMNDFIELFSLSLSHEDGLLEQVLSHIRQRGGKRMRPMLLMLSAKNYGKVSDVTLNAALGLELLHTASLVHDDVVDESGERRGQASVNASFNNKVAVLVGDFILSTALLRVATVSCFNSQTSPIPKFRKIFIIRLLRKRLPFFSNHALL